MMKYPATELFNAAGERQVVWSEEGYNAALADGWSEDRPESPASTESSAKLGPGRPKKEVIPNAERNDRDK